MEANKRITLPPITDGPWYESVPMADEKEVNEQETVVNEVAALMVMRAALIETTASRGWLFVERIAEAVVRDLEKKALEEDDDTKSSGLRRDARGARKFKDDLFRRIQIARNFDNKDSFVEVVTD